MFLANKQAGRYLLEYTIFSIVTGYFLSDITMSIIGILPNKFFELAISVIILISVAGFISSFISKRHFLPFSVELWMMLNLVNYCVIHNLSYLPTPYRIMIVTLIAISAVYPICGIWREKKWYYVYQFNLIELIKCIMIAMIPGLFFDVVDSIYINFAYTFFLIPIVLFLLLCMSVGKSNINKALFYAL